MMRSMYSGVAGLKTHQTKMDVIGNNIANVNTVAYKSQSVTFSELMYQTTQSASGPNATTGTGGVNARQIGLGVKSGAINTNISSQGASQTTNNPFDIMITGDAFFVVSNGQENFFTRDGSFYVDGGGNLAMTSNGYNVMGWGVDPETMDIKQDTVQALRIMAPENLTYPPEATSKAYLSGIIDKNDTNVTSSSGKNINLQIYDDLGYSYTARLNLKSTTEEGTYGLEMTGLLDENNNKVDLTGFQFGTGNKVDLARETSLVASEGYEWTLTGFKTPAKTYTTAEVEAALGTLKADDPVIKELMAAYGLESVSDFDDYTFSVTGYNTDQNDPTKVANGTFTLKELLLNTQITLSDNTTKVNARELLEEKINRGKADADKIDIANADDLKNMMGNLTANGKKIDGYLVKYDPTTGVFQSVGNGESITLDLADLTVNVGNDKKSKFENIEIDFSTTTMYNNSGSSTIAATSGDKDGLGTGRKLGEMSGISIQQNGMIYASYDNGQTKLLGQIAVAEFANASGLEKQGDNLYSATLNSGEFDGIGVDITAGGGYMNTGVLEMSNVDLSAEFTEMITTQRGFQANSRIITVSDTLLEELVNLKR